MMNWKLWKSKLTKEQIEKEISEIYKNAPHQGKYGLLVGDGSSQSYWELQHLLSKLNN